MNWLGNLSLEYKSGIVFGIAALFFSFITGIIFGIGIIVVIIRTLILTSTFLGLGIGIIFVIKKYVPELYEYLKGMKKKSQTDEDLGIDEELGIDKVDEVETVSDEELSDTVPEEAIIENTPELSPDNKFSELDENNFQHLESVDDTDTDSNIDVSKGKLGTHIIANQSFGKYEPKIMAKAIRTMMSKDEE